MVLHFRNAALHFDAFFLSIPGYCKRARTISRLVHARNVQDHIQASACKKCGSLWWCMHIAHANLRQSGLFVPTRLCRICHTLQSRLQLQTKHLQKLTLGLRVLYEKWTKNSNYHTTILLKSSTSVCGTGTAVTTPRGSVYELWCDNNQAQPNCKTLPSVQVPSTMHLQHAYLPTSHHLHGKKTFS